jgi:hypothetical protein
MDGDEYAYVDTLAARHIARFRRSKKPAQELADLKLAYDLLAGIPAKDEKGLPVQKYFEAGSRDELEARQALARLLRNGKPLDSLVRVLLADMFDPAPYAYFTKSTMFPAEARERVPDRQIYFKNVGRRSREDVRRRKLAYEVWQAAKVAREDSSKAAKNGGSIEDAVAAVAEKYGISEASVWNAWRQFKSERWAEL